ncbi:MAG: putative toxin-antitoxin system toxin component, PIN family [Moraxellaceae bacterium]
MDTNVVFSALYSGTNPASVLQRALLNDGLLPCVSTSLLLEYEQTLLTKLDAINRARGVRGWDRVRKADVQLLLDNIVAAALCYSTHLTARPTLPDPDDEKVLDLVLVAGATLVTGNQKDFKAAIAPFKIEVVSCTELLKRVLR